MKQPYINDVVVSVEPWSGTLRRYEGGRMSHEAIAREAVIFTPEMIEGFRVRPDPQFRISSAFHPLPIPPDGSPRAATVAA